MDRRCIYCKKPLLESSAEGLKARTAVVKPYLTECYYDVWLKQQTHVPIPIHTLGKYPFKIDHCIMVRKTLPIIKCTNLCVVKEAID